LIQSTPHLGVYRETNMAKMYIAVLVILLVIVRSSIAAGMRREWIPMQRNQVDPDLGDDAPSTSIVSIRPELLLSQTSLSTNQSTPCERDLAILILAASQRELWALKVFDAWGKPLPPGILKGNIFWLGNYGECVDELYQEKNRSFVRQPIDTQFCRSIAFLSVS
jgi:hypothetical protein